MKQHHNSIQRVFLCLVWLSEICKKSLSQQYAAPWCGIQKCHFATIRMEFGFWCKSGVFLQPSLAYLGNDAESSSGGTFRYGFPLLKSYKTYIYFLKHLFIPAWFPPQTFPSASKLNISVSGCENSLVLHQIKNRIQMVAKNRQFCTTIQKLLIWLQERII